MNTDIQNYLDDIQLVSAEFYPFILQVRELFLNSPENLTESIKYGGIVYSRNNDLIGGIFTYKKHVSIEFSQGFQLSDTDSVLEGKGKYRRHIKLNTVDDINNKKVEEYINQAIALSG